MTAVEQTSMGWRLWLWRGLLALGLLIGATGDIEFLSTAAAGRTAAMGVTWGPSTVAEPQWVHVAGLAHGSPAETAGLRVGDDVRFDRPFATSFLHYPGERLPATIARDGRRFRIVLTANVDTGFFERTYVRTNVGEAAISLVVFAFCVLLLRRGGRRRAPLLLASILFVMHLFAGPTLWVPVSFALAWLYLDNLFSGLFLLYAVPTFCAEVSGGPVDGNIGRLIRWGVLAVAAAGIYWQASGTIIGHLPGAGPALAVVLIVASTGFGILVMVLNYARADAVTRNRIWIVALAFACFGMRATLGQVFNSLLAQGYHPSHLLGIITGTFAFEFAAVSLLVYAVLKQRLFDLSFAINRTLVYGAVSFTLLAAFGLAEWGADRLVPESWHHESALYSAGIALLLFLSFHRVRDWFEKHVESLFFAGWQRAQADLRRFVASAGHFRQAPALCREFAAEVERFAQGAPAALYLREDDGGFVQQCGSLADAAESYSDEDRLFPLLNAERVPVDLSEAHSGLPGAMAFPMLDQLGLAGFVLVGSRPDGAHYRPDEIDNLAWATQQVGLDLQALQARELRAEVAALREQLAARPVRRRKPRLAAVSGGATA